MRMTDMEWKFDEPRWSIMLSMYGLSEYITYDQMAIVSIYPVKELIKNYGNVMNLIVTISEKDTETFQNTFKTYSNETIATAIDVLIECAIDNEVPTITTLLLDYKYKNNLFTERDWRL